jgi:hypothetical protein
MWILREFLRLVSRIAVAVAIATAIAGARAAISGGDMLHTWKVMLFVLGCLSLLLAGFGNTGSAANRRLNKGVDHAANFVFRIPGVPATTEGPTLTASAVFAGSGIALLALGFLV